MTLPNKVTFWVLWLELQRMDLGEGGTQFNHDICPHLDQKVRWRGALSLHVTGVCQRQKSWVYKSTQSCFLAEQICVYLKTCVDLQNKLHLLLYHFASKCPTRARQHWCQSGNTGSKYNGCNQNLWALLGEQSMWMLLWLATIIPALHSEPPPEAIDIYLETNCAAVWDLKWKKISSQCNPSWNEMAAVAPEENCSIKSKANLNSKDRRARAMREMRVSVFQNHHCILIALQSA